jgi:cytochrome c-type biogenesis protein CcmH/NrfG
MLHMPAGLHPAPGHLAEFEFSRAVKLDEDNVWANFWLGRTYMAMGEGNKAKQVFHKLFTIETMLEQRN